MFASGITDDRHSTQMTRRAFLGGAAAVAAASGALVLFHPPGLEASTAVHGTPGMVTIARFADNGRPLGLAAVPKIVKTDGAWYRQLGKVSFALARRADTELPLAVNGSRRYGPGMFRCLCCGTALFSSASKYDSGTGWPAFTEPIAKENIVERPDRSLETERTEIQCVRCEAHLGHVFGDGPLPHGLRYCINSGVLAFHAAQVCSPDNRHFPGFPNQLDSGYQRCFVHQGCSPDHSVNRVARLSIRQFNG